MNNFQKLTPEITTESTHQNQVYKEAFDFVFLEPQLRNIAVSGSFGAGKSSVFATYMENWKQSEKIIRISLAHFSEIGECGNEDEYQITSDSEKRKQNEISLEAKIINQLIHQIKPNRIKKTRFIARVSDRKWWQNLLLSLVGTFTIFIIFFLLSFTRLEPILVNPMGKGFGTSTIEVAAMILGLFLLCLLPTTALFFIILFLVQRSRGKSLLKRFSIKDFTIDLSEDSTDSFFDKYLSEIRYLFDNCDSTIVAIEDIDRYYSCSIFEKIRELNTIVNYERTKNPIRFFYIIKDDILKSYERTKFFDFIIPIIPIIDSSNSYSQLRKLLDSNGKYQKISSRFLRGLSVYIDDMRLLKNIVNEFLIYRNQLANQFLDQTKLLALITYKNIFPRDFNDLQAGKGYLFSLIQLKNDLRRKVIDQENKKIIELEEKIKKIEEEHLENIQELGSLMFKPVAYLERVGSLRVDQFGSQQELFSAISKNPTQVYSYNSNQADQTNKLSELYKNANYVARKEVIDQKMRGEIETLKAQKMEIVELVKSITEYQGISSLISTDEFTEFLYTPCGQEHEKYNEITGDLHFNIIRFLIQNKLIDGYYQDSLSYFYDSEIKIQDQVFIRSIYDQNPLPDAHVLTNPQAVLEILEGISEINPAFLNKSLFLYVFDKMLEDEAEKFVQLLKKHKNFALVLFYLHSGSQRQFLIRTINRYWDSFFKTLLEYADWNEGDITLFLQIELAHEMPEVLSELNGKNAFDSKIKKNRNILSGLSSEHLSGVIKNLISINLKFSDIGSLNASDDLLDEIYRNNLYECTLQNARFWLRNKYKIPDTVSEGYVFSSICLKPNEPLCVYVFSDLGKLLENIIEVCPNVEFSDEQTAVFEVLGSSLDPKNKMLYIDHLVTVIEDVSSMEDEDVIEALLERNLIAFQFNNIIALFDYFNEEIPESVSNYLHENENEVLQDKTINLKMYSNTKLSKFFDAVLGDETLGGSITTTLLKATGIKIKAETNSISVEKAKALVISKTLVMTVENLEFIRKNHQDLVLLFEKNNLNDFKELIKSGEMVVPQEIVDLLESGINCTEQLSLLRRVKNVQIPYKQSYKCLNTKKHIIKFLLADEDLKEVIKDTQIKHAVLSQTVIELITDRVDRIISQSIAMPFDLYQLCINKKEIPTDKMVELFINSMPLFTNSQIWETIRVLRISPFDKLLIGKRPKFVNTPSNQKILDYLEKNGMAKYSAVTGGIRKLSGVDDV